MIGTLFLNLRGKIYGGVAIPTFLLIVIGIISLLSINTIRTTGGWVDHTHEAIEEAQDIMINAIDMETGMRGFLLAGKEEFLGPYKQGAVKAFSEIEELEENRVLFVGRLKKELSHG